MRFLCWISFFAILISVVSCRHTDDAIDLPYEEKLPEGFPPIIYPEDNAPTVARIELGKMLFYEPLFSRDNSISCASCHLPAYAFADTLAVSLGVEGRLGTRNSISLTNVAYQQRLLREGGVPSLEMQVLVPIQEHNEFNENIIAIAEKLQQIPEYVALSEKAYQRPLDAFVITRAIAAFERTLISGNSPYDQYHFQGKTTAMSEAARRGEALFFSDSLKCGNCHNGINFTNGQFENNGLYESYTDEGLARLTHQEGDVGKFKVASLRNLGYTAPYMFDGSLPDLAAVVAHYAQGGSQHANKSGLLKGFSLSEAEKADLITFLHSLDDADFVGNVDFLP
ncbi:MAG: cytochrome c peroxidase [Chitinophagales bacterium]|nr:cytochrome-c peroxidase [Bacteroidota bacterium]